jgi:hypothetical protein
MVDIQTLEGRLQALDGQSADCVRMLRETADALRQRRHGPSRRSLDLIARFCGEYDAIRSELLPDRLAEQDRPTLPELTLACVQQHTRHLAAALLDRVLAIRRSDSSQFPALDQCHADARNLRSELLSSHGVRTQDLAQALLSGRHSLAALLELVALGNILSDEQWTRQQDIVQEAYGKELAVAVARHKLFCPAAATATSGSSPRSQESVTGSPAAAPL